MPILNADDYGRVQPLVAAQAAFSLSVDAVLAGTAAGEIWAERPEDPRVAFMSTSEGHFLAGDPAVREADAELRQVIPHHAYLNVDPATWEPRLPEIWENSYARPHLRQHFLLRTLALTDWRARIPAGFDLRLVDRALLERTELINHHAVAGWVDSWRSAEAFLEHGFGVCLVEGDVIASWCLSDCVQGQRCEVGIRTDGRYRRRGLAATVVAAAVEHTLGRGFTEVGWHCLASNAGSIAVAQRVGFESERLYTSFSSGLPAENAADLSATEYADWARHYEQAARNDQEYGFAAAEAWALAGEGERAIAALGALIDGGWSRPSRWLSSNWCFAALRGLPAFEALIARLPS